MPKRWTDENVEQTIHLIKTEDPQLWKRYLTGEKEHHHVDEDNSLAMYRLARSRLFPDATLGDLGTLLFEIRVKVRSELGLEWPKGNLAGLEP